MFAFQCAPHKVHTCVQLRRAAAVVLEQQRRIAADLADAHELCENLDLALSETLLRLVPQHCLHPDYLCVVEAPLLLPKADVVRLLHLFREVFQDFRLQTAKNKGRHHSPKPPGDFLVPVSHDRPLQLVSEGLVAVEEARHQVIEDAPELTEPVFNRSAGQGKAMLRTDDFDRFCRSGGLIFDKLSLVQHLVQKQSALITGDISLQMVIGSDDHVPFSAALDDLLPLRLRTLHRTDRELRGKAAEFFLPVVDQGGRADDQRGADHAFQLFGQQHGNHLQCFPEAHLVREDAAETAS